jgi:hypothetical protein
MAMIRTSDIDRADSVAPSDIDAVLTNASWAIGSTYHTVLKASPGATIFGRDMLFGIPFIAASINTDRCKSIFFGIYI